MTLTVMEGVKPKYKYVHVDITIGWSDPFWRLNHNNSY